MSNKKQLSTNAKVSFFKARRREGDVTALAETTNYSQSHVSNVIAGRRSAPQRLADAMYSLTRRRSVATA
jgi:hypothetical protein